MPEDNKLGPSRRNVLKKTGAAMVGGSLVTMAGCSGGGGSGGGSTLRWSYTSGAELATPTGFFFQSDYVKSEVMPNVGEEYEIEVTGVQGSSLVASAIGSGEVDGGVLAYSSAASTLEEEAIPSGFSIVAPEVWMGFDNFFDDLYAAPADSGITEKEDIVGKDFATNAVGSAIDIGARVGLKRAGIDPEEDVNMRELGFGAMATALDEGRIDVGSFVQPLWEPVKDDMNVLYDMASPFGTILALFGVFRNDFLEENEETVRMFLEDQWNAVQWYASEGEKSEVVEAVADMTELPQDRLSSIIRSDTDYYHGNDGFKIDPASIQGPVDGMKEVGYLDADLTMADYVDNSYLPDEANQEPDI